MYFIPFKDRIRRFFSSFSTSWRRKSIKCRVTSVKDWCKIHSLPYYTLREAAAWNVPGLKHIGDPDQTKAIGTITLPEIYLAEVDNARIIGGHNPVLVGDGVALYDDYMHPERELFDYNQKGDLITYGPDNHITVQYKQSPGPVIEAGILLSGVYSFNYYHWLFDFLSRFWIIDQFPEYNDLPLIIDDNLHSNLYESLDMVNTHKRPIIPIRYGMGYTIKNLIIPSKLAFMPQNLKGNIPLSYRYDAVSPIAVTYLREKLGVERRMQAHPMKTRLYISRRKAKYRKLQNEHKIERIFKQYNFSVVQPELMSFREQLDLFSSAEIIAGATGSGLANILFAPSSVRVMLFLCEDSYIFSNIAQIIGQNLVNVYCSYIPGSCSISYHCDFRIEPDVIEKAIQSFIPEREKNLQFHL
jgi:capsular polysaccharide biosynthesis protein